MGNNPKILITTSNNPSESARSFCLTLAHVIPDSIYLNRGGTNIEAIHTMAIENAVNYVLFVFSKGNMVSKVKISKVSPKELVRTREELQILQFIDYQILGWKYLPEKGPLSTSLEARQKHPKLYEFFEKYFQISYGTKNPLWLMVDIKDYSTYIQFVDSLTLRKIFFAEVKLRTSDTDE